MTFAAQTANVEASHPRFQVRKGGSASAFISII